MSLSFSDCLNKCLSSNTKERNEGEAFLEHKCSENYGLLLSEIANILTDEGVNLNLRQLCATLIKNLLNKQQYEKKWDDLPKITKDEIKNKILACLASTSHEICRLTALAIASICRKDIPSGNWNEIVSILFSTSQNPNPAYRLSSVITIGYIAQDLKEGDLFQEQVNCFLTALITNLTPGNDQLFKFTAISFANILLFAKNNFANNEERTIILDKLITLINNPSVSNEIKVYLFQALIGIVRLYYMYIHDKMNEIITISCNHLKSNYNQLAIQSIELLSSLCEEEIMRIKSCSDKCNYYAKQYQQEIFNSLQEVLENRNGHDLEDEWTPLKGIKVLIEFMAQCTNNDFLNNVLSFVGKYLNKPNIYLKDSAYLAFGAILVSHSMDTNVVKSSLPELFTQINQSNDFTLKNTIAWCLCQLFEFQYNILIDEMIFDSTIHSLCDLIQTYSNKPKLLIKICKALNEIVIKSPKKIYLNKHLMLLLNLLLKTGFLKGLMNSEANISEACCFTIEKLIQITPNDTSIEVFGQFFSNVFQLFSDSFNQSLFTCSNDQIMYQNYLAIIICSCSSEKIKMNSEQLHSVYKLIKQTFINRQCVYEEGLIACSSLAYSSPSAFLTVLEDYIPFLLVGLKSFNEKSLCSRCVTSTSDLIIALRNHVSPYLPNLIEVIFNILNDENCDKFLKTKCFIVLSDIFSITTMTESYSYYQQAMQVANNAMAAAIIPTKEDDDPDVIQYFLQLREGIVEFFSCVITFLNEHNKNCDFECYLNQTMHFLNTICQKNYSPTINLMIESLGLIGDLCITFKGKMKQYLRKDIISYILSSLKNIKNENVEKVFNWSNNVSNYFIYNIKINLLGNWKGI